MLHREELLSKLYSEFEKEEERTLSRYAYLDEDGNVYYIDTPLCFARKYAYNFCKDKAREYGHEVALYSVNARGRIYYTRHIDVLTKKERAKNKRA